MKHFTVDADVMLRDFSVPGHWAKVPARVDISIDLDAIAKQIGAKALKNKRKRSRALGGLITVEARRR